MTDPHSPAQTPPGFIIREFATLPPKIRPALAEKVAKLERKVFPAIEHFNYDVELKKKNTGLLLVFKGDDTDERLIAYLVYQRMKRLAWLHKLCVIEQERGRGLGKALVCCFRQQMEKGGCSTIFLWVDESRKPARALYKSCGFQQAECRPDYYGPERTALKLELELRG
jgi:ribosomal protein S18 acetylase RimI-like enzyme